jgi:hypothetical protein
MTIQTIRTWYGTKFAILDENGNVVNVIIPKSNVNRLAWYSNTKAGLEQAREDLSLLKKSA